MVLGMMVPRALIAAALLWAAVMLSAACVGQSAPVVTLFEQTDTVPRISGDRAVTGAVKATGLKVAPSSAEYGLATDTSIPFSDLKVVKRLAWKVEFKGIEIFGKNRQGVLQKNPNISSLTVLIDAQNGAVLKVFSPERGLGGLLEWPDERMELHLSGGGIVLKSASRAPTVPFMKALSIASDSQGRFAREAKEVVAYFGLMTDPFSLRMDNKVVDRPFWVIIAGGLDQGGLSVPSGFTGPIPRVRQAYVAVDAESGKWYRGGYTSAGN